jgi:hypothetical protein
MSGDVIVSFRGQLYHIAVDPATTTLGQLCSAVQQAIPGLAPHTLKLLLSKPRSQTLQLDREQDVMLSSFGKLVLLCEQQWAGLAIAVHAHDDACAAIM